MVKINSFILRKNHSTFCLDFNVTTSNNNPSLSILLCLEKIPPPAITNYSTFATTGTAPPCVSSLAKHKQSEQTCKSKIILFFRAAIHDWAGRISVTSHDWRWHPDTLWVTSSRKSPFRTLWCKIEGNKLHHTKFSKVKWILEI